MRAGDPAKTARSLGVTGTDEQVTAQRDGVRYADWLSLAATPVFAIMAFLTSTDLGAPANLLCSPGRDALLLSGMTAMYALMSAFHAAPWLKLVFKRP